MNKTNSPRAITAMLLHLHPMRVDARSIAFTRTFGLGGVATLLFLLLVISGILLRFAYVPYEKGAYNSLVSLQREVIFGQLLRNFHYWSGMGMIMASFLHMLRVFYSQSLYFERRKNWIYGLLLLFLVVFSNFTGYLLPWDQLSFWAVTIMTNMLGYIPFIGDFLAGMARGGGEVSETTLLRFYSFHTGLLPLCMVFLMGMHFWLVRKARGVAVEGEGQKRMISTYPGLVHRELVVALSVIIALLLLSMTVNAPLQKMANPLLSPNPSKAPWYFMGFQELLLHVHPLFGVLVIPLLVAVFLILLPFVNSSGINVGVYFNSDKGKKLVVLSFFFSVIFTTTLNLSLELLVDTRSLFPGVWSVISTGLLPFCISVMPAAFFLVFLKFKLRAQRVEVMMALFTIIMTAYLVMTIVGSFFRGEGMQLIW